MLEAERPLLANCLWTRDPGDRRRWPPLAGELRVEIAIVGAGYTGLAAALHLAEAGRSVVVLEAAQPGHGASGRNGGQVIAGLKEPPERLLALFGERPAERLARFAAGSATAVFDLVRRQQIRCDAVAKGWLQPAHDAASLAEQAQVARQWQAVGLPLELLDAAGMARRLGSSAYRGGLLDPGSGQLQPFLYVQGLALAAEAAGARLFGASKVTALRREAGKWRLEAGQGRVIADQVVLATNGYTGDLLPGLRQSIVPVISAQIATEPLPPSIALTILPEDQPASDTRRLLVYFRKDAAGRFVIGGRGAENDWQLGLAFKRLERIARRLYPALAGIAFPWHWGGRVALTTDHLPHLHAPAPGLTVALGYNGRGVAMATAMGGVVAQRLTGRADADLPLPVTPLRPIPMHRLRSVGVAAMGVWYRLRDRV